MKQLKQRTKMKNESTSKYSIEKRAEHIGIKYLIGHQPPNGYRVLPADDESKEIFGEKIWFDTFDEAEEHAKISIDSYLDGTDESASLTENYIHYKGYQIMKNKKQLVLENKIRKMVRESYYQQELDKLDPMGNIKIMFSSNGIRTKYLDVNLESVDGIIKFLKYCKEGLYMNRRRQDGPDTNPAGMSFLDR